MNNNIKALLELINENPDLPVVCMVDNDIVRADYESWMAQIGWCEVGEYASYNDRFYDDRENFTEDYLDNNAENLNQRFGKEEKQIDEYLAEVADRAFKRAIVVHIDALDDVEEVEDEIDL